MSSRQLTQRLVEEGSLPSFEQHLTREGEDMLEMSIQEENLNFFDFLASLPEDANGVLAENAGFVKEWKKP